MEYRKRDKQYVNKDNQLLFNWKCIMEPSPVLDYIVVHDMCHMVYKNHSKEFWHLLKRVLPDYEQKKKNILLIVMVFIVLTILAIIAMIKLRNKELRFLARIDNLTKLKNRNALFEDYKKREQLNTKKVYFIDLDDFKFINDNYGHDAGDEVLKVVSKRLTDLAPKADIYRMGGDEFLLLTESNEMNLGKKILEIIQDPILYKGKKCKVYGSIGYLVTDDFLELQFNEIINLADYAMLEAKSTGKNNILKVNVDIIKKFENLLDKKI